MLDHINIQTVLLLCAGFTVINLLIVFVGVLAVGIMTALNYKMYTEYFKDISRTKAFENGKKG